MRTLLPLLLSCLAICCLSAPLSATNPAAPAQPTTDTPAASQSGKGTVITTDASMLTIDVRVTDAQGKNATTLVLTLNAATKITRNKKTAIFTAIQPGDLVQFSFTSGADPSQGNATSVDAKTKPKGKKGAPAAN